MTSITFLIIGTMPDRSTTNEIWDKVQKGSSSEGLQSRGVEKTKMQNDVKRFICHMRSQRRGICPRQKAMGMGAM